MNSRETIEKYWLENFKVILKDGRLNISQMHGRLMECKVHARKETVSRWVKVFIASGMLCDEWDGSNHYIKLKLAGGKCNAKK